MRRARLERILQVEKTGPEREKDISPVLQTETESQGEITFWLIAQNSRDYRAPSSWGWPLAWLSTAMVTFAFCVTSHTQKLRKEGMTAQNIADIGRIASVVKAVSDVLTFDEYLRVPEAA